MNRTQTHQCGFMLLELIFMLTAAALVLFVLNKLLLDGLYLQRVADERINRASLIDGLVERLRRDALQAAGHAWRSEPNRAALTFEIPTHAAVERVEWIFRPTEITRRVNNCDFSAFSASRLSFEARLEAEMLADLLHLKFVVQPPERSRLTKPRVSEIRILLSRESGSSPTMTDGGSHD